MASEVGGSTKMPLESILKDKYCITGGVGTWEATTTTKVATIRKGWLAMDSREEGRE